MQPARGLHSSTMDMSLLSRVRWFEVGYASYPGRAPPGGRDISNTSNREWTVGSSSPNTTLHNISRACVEAALAYVRHTSGCGVGKECVGPPVGLVISAVDNASVLDWVDPLVLNSSNCLSRPSRDASVGAKHGAASSPDHERISRSPARRPHTQHVARRASEPTAGVLERSGGLYHGMIEPLRSVSIRVILFGGDPVADGALVNNSGFGDREGSAAQGINGSGVSEPPTTTLLSTGDLTCAMRSLATGWRDAFPVGDIPFITLALTKDAGEAVRDGTLPALSVAAKVRLAQASILPRPSPVLVPATLLPVLYARGPEVKIGGVVSVADVAARPTSETCWATVWRGRCCTLPLHCNHPAFTWRHTHAWSSATARPRMSP